MPPTTAPIPLPQTRGRDLLDYIEAHGFLPCVPTIRSSDEQLIADPFLYWCRRRMGWVSVFSGTEATNRGSYFHAWLQGLEGVPEDRQRLVDERFAARSKEITNVCNSIGSAPDTRNNLIMGEEQDAKCASAWSEVACNLKINEEYGTLLQYLNRSYWKVLGTELRGIWNDPKYKGTPLVVQFDRLMLHTGTNTLWILDWKTCSTSATERLRICPTEFQTWHYLYVLGKLLENGILQKKFDLPADVKVGGMIHVGLQKPTIDFGSRDRPYWYASESKRSGLRGVAHPKKKDKWGIKVKALSDAALQSEEDFIGNEEAVQVRLAELVGTKAKKEFGGEPDFNLYLERCRDWFQGTGDYADKQAEREANKPIDVSITTRHRLDTNTLKEYHAILSEIHELATCDPLPENFRRSSVFLNNPSRKNIFTPLYLMDGEKWVEWLRDQGIIRAFRDDDLVGKEVDSDVGVYG